LCLDFSLTRKLQYTMFHLWSDPVYCRYRHRGVGCKTMKEGDIMRTYGLRSCLSRAHGSVVISFFLVAVCFGLPGASSVNAGLELPNHRSADPWTNLLPLSSRNSLLDPSKLDISHELVFSYYSGSTAKGNTGGLFLTRFQYPLSSPLVLDLTIGSSLSHSQLQGFQSNELFIQNFSLRYSPNDNFFLIFTYDGAPYNRLYFPTH
jgi:hypothetical protein